MLTVLRTTDVNVADKNIYFTSILHVSRTDQNCVVLKRAENTMRHVEMCQRSERNSARVGEDVLKSEGFSHKIVQVINKVNHREQRMMLAFLCFLFFQVFL